ncbi:MAG TPA: hypothetical protein VJ739_18180 [Gemmataceae bacterium]|nr:hypothetical protein [Gemmataceae bacterium]
MDLATARDVGGWVFAAVTLAAVLAWGGRALISGRIVSGKLHERVLDQNDKLSEAITRLTGAVETLADRIEDLRDAARGR